MRYAVVLKNGLVSFEVDELYGEAFEIVDAAIMQKLIHPDSRNQIVDAYPINSFHLEVRTKVEWVIDTLNYASLDEIEKVQRLMTAIYGRIFEFKIVPSHKLPNR